MICAIIEATHKSHSLFFLYAHLCASLSWFRIGLPVCDNVFKELQCYFRRRIVLIKQKIFALIAGIAIFLSILEMVRRRKLREEYSWLWLLTGCGIIVLVVWYDLLVFITELIGAVLPTTTLFLFGLIFLMLIALHYSMKISALTDQVRKLAQELAILKAESGEQDQGAESLKGKANRATPNEWSQK